MPRGIHHAAHLSSDITAEQAADDGGVDRDRDYSGAPYST